MNNNFDNTMDIRDAFFDTLYEIALKDSNVILLVADMGAFSLEKFRKDLPDQYINVGIAEQNLVNVASGLAIGGKKVFIYAIAPFIIQRCYEQIKVNLSGMKLPITILGIGGGITYSNDGSTHHAVQDIANMRALPGMNIISPSDSVSFSRAAYDSYTSDYPTYVRLDKGVVSELYDSVNDTSNGISELRTGKDILLISTGLMTHTALRVTESLKEFGFNAGVIDIYRILPLNKDLILNLIKKYSHIVTLEEHYIYGGIGSIIQELLAEMHSEKFLFAFAIKDIEISGYGSREWMCEQYGLDSKSIIDKIIELTNKKSATNLSNTRKKIIFNSSNKKELDLESFKELLGCDEDNFDSETKQFINNTDFGYTSLNKQEEEELNLNILNRLDSSEFTKSGPQKKAIWEKGWSENLSEFRKNKYSLDKLVPKFVRNKAVKRLCGKYIMPSNPSFETDFVTVLRNVIFKKYFHNVERIFEFGCGTGLNLVALAKQYPKKKLYGLDWSESSCEIINQIAKEKKIDVSSILFDLFDPKYSVDVAHNDGVLTIGTLEQLGNNFTPFLDYLLTKGPRICINIETMNEIYSNNTLTDYVALKYTKERNYLWGFLTALQELERQNRVEIISLKRVFGPQFHEGYSFVVWRPII